MVRFIFICMGVVFVSFLSIAGQGIFEGVEKARNEILARNAAMEAQSAKQVATKDETELSPENLNAIVPAAGSFDETDHFSGGFTDVAPKALAD